jgi:hypothetical protein
LLLGLGPWLLGWTRAIQAWDPMRNLVGTDIGPAGLLLRAIVYVRDELPTAYKPVSDLAGKSLDLPALPGILLFLGVLAVATYRFAQWFWWERWDRRARNDFLVAGASSRRKHVIYSTEEEERSTPTAAPAI